MNRLHRLDRWAWLLFVLGLVAALVITAWDHGGRWHTPRLELRNFIMLWLYWAPRLAGVPLLVGLLTQFALDTRWRRWRLPVYAALVLVGLWSSLVEPQWIQVRHTTISGIPPAAQPLRLAVVADIHWGLFFRDHQLDALVNQLNGMDVDAVLVAGDWTHEPSLNLREGLAPLSRIRHPVWGVLGNHDVQAPGPDLTLPLREALQAHGVRLIEGQVVPWKGWELVGLDDQWGGRPQEQIRSLWPAGVSAASPRLVVVHQPDTVALLPVGAAFLSVAGHTHGGQIWIPGLTPWYLRHTNSQQSWWNGLYDTPAGRLLVTPGVGTIGLPARLAVRPTIDRVDLVR
ncbi:MAG: metallophosphoesterase [Hydrogenophaga sp.]|uniref:metallophosphoesterase n=1 Tax=Hydrogenophaga sp. TaxID=1904254 RepID=UPI0025C61319|nr:metallophosphoesterase [Hydrogenophaga sp.]MBT9551324.1 metallophosphoesterase [Hydrogenophaga sp.]